MRVLVIEDDSATAQSIELMLKSESFNVYTTDLGEEGIDLGKIYDYDIILLDLNLPDMSGFEVLRSLRVSKVKTPTLILSGLVGIEDKVKGLGFGADDYMTKPFHKDELVARIHAIVRRSKGHAQSVIESGDLVVNLDTKMVEINGARVHLTSKEYQILELLSLRKGMTQTKDMILNHLYGGMDEPELKIIDVFICCGKTRQRLLRQELYRNRVGSRLRVAAPRGRRRGQDISLTLRICGIVAAQGTITMSSDQPRQRAEKSFKQDERARDGRKAMTEYEAQARATREKTARLKALRLAKEAQAQSEEPPPKQTERRPTPRAS